MLIAVDNKHPKGSVLIFTFGILLLVSLMGVAVMVNTKSETASAVSTYYGREAFSKSTATGQIALMLLNIMIKFNQDPRAVLNNTNSGTGSGLGTLPTIIRPDFEVEIDPSVSHYSDIYKLGDVTTLDDITERYLGATDADNATRPPHVTVRHGGQVIGTAYMAYGTVTPPGKALDEAPDIVGVISIDGRIGDNMNYYDESPLTRDVKSARSITTIIFQWAM